jgi:hypothetical protein
LGYDQEIPEVIFFKFLVIGNILRSDFFIHSFPISLEPANPVPLSIFLHLLYNPIFAIKETAYPIDGFSAAAATASGAGIASGRETVFRGGIGLGGHVPAGGAVKGAQEQLEPGLGGTGEGGGGIQGRLEEFV